MRSVDELINEAFEREREKLSGFKEIEGGERTGMIDNYGWDFFNRSCECTLDALNSCNQYACSSIDIDGMLNNINNVLTIEKKDERHLKRSDLKLVFKRDVFRFMPTISSKDRLKLKF